MEKHTTKYMVVVCQGKAHGVVYGRHVSGKSTQRSIWLPCVTLGAHGELSLLSCVSPRHTMNAPSVVSPSHPPLTLHTPLPTAGWVGPAGQKFTVCCPRGTRRRRSLPYVIVVTHGELFFRRVPLCRREFFSRHTAFGVFVVCPTFRTRRTILHMAYFYFPVVSRGGLLALGWSRSKTSRNSEGEVSEGEFEFDRGDDDDESDVEWSFLENSLRAQADPLNGLRTTVWRNIFVFWGFR